MKKVLIIDSDRKCRKLIAGILKSDYEVLASSDIDEGYSLISSASPDIIIIDPLYPKKEGLAFIESVRKWIDCPIIAVCANGTEIAAVTVINSGADDYIRKPFFTDELSARIAACVRHIERLEAAKGINSSFCYINNGLKLEYDTHSCSVDNEKIHLTKNEFKILSLLCRHAGKVLTHEFILKSVWGPRADSDTGILRVNITNLRRKIEKNPLLPQYVLTENGIGYRALENQAI